MPDLKNFSITRGLAVSATVSGYTISGKIVDSRTQQTVLADFTGANALSFPAVLAQLTAEDRDELMRLIAHWLIEKRFPGAFS